MSSLCLSVADGLVKGVVTGLLPGTHPLLFSFLSSPSTATAYGVYSVLSIVPAVLVGAYSADNAFASVGARKDVRYYIYGALFALVVFFTFFPLWAYLSIRPPRLFVALILLLFSSLTIISSRNKVGAFFVALLSGVLGYVVLKTAVGVAYPLVWLMMGLYGLSNTLWIQIGKEVLEVDDSPGEWMHGAVLGFIAGSVVAYIPSASLSLVLFLFAPILERIPVKILATTSAAMLPAAAVFVSGLAGLCLLFAATSIGLISRFLGVEKRVLMFSLLIPTLIYYL